MKLGFLGINLRAFIFIDLLLLYERTEMCEIEKQIQGIFWEIKQESTSKLGTTYTYTKRIE